MFVSHSYLSGTTRTLRTHFECTSATLIEKFQLGKTDLVLDLGGNDGTYLEFYHKQGFRTLNIDSGKYQAFISASKGIPTINDFFTSKTSQQILKNFGMVKVIHASGILFHLENLHEAFENIKILLSTDGVLVAEFIYLPEMVKKVAYDQIYHEHLVYYTLFSFQNLLNQFGLEIFDCEFFPIHGGTCMAYISHKGLMKKTQSINTYLAQEISNNFHTNKPLLKFASDVIKSRSSLNQLISDYLNKNKVIYLLGAPVKGSTLVNFLGLDEKIAPIAVEKNPLKFNTFFPGTKIKVVDETKVRPPDVFLLLSWNFQDEIISRYNEFLLNGGIIVNPIPYPTEVKY
jgi:hypothetical protein